MTTVREIKRNLDGRVLRFECELLYRDAGRAVLHYVSPTGYEFAEVQLEAGCHTTALYRVGQPYVFWRITAPDGTLHGHYLHLAENIRIKDKGVTWDDLAVDVWVWPDGRHAVWDEDELRAFHERGLVSAEKVATIEGVKREVVGRLAEVVAEAEAELRRVVGDG